MVVYVQLMYTRCSARRPEFDWDEHNERHLANHGISRSEAEDVLSGDDILWNTKWKGTNNAGLLSVRLAPVAYWTSYLQFGARRCVR